MARNLFIMIVVVLVTIFIMFLNTSIFYKKVKNSDGANRTDVINIFENKDNKIIEDNNYDFSLELNKNIDVKGYDKFIKVSDKKIEDEIKNDQCILNFSTEETKDDVCEYIKKECEELGCKKYICEKYNRYSNKNWYKAVEYGDFFGTGDIIFIQKNNDYMYFLNLECANKKDDNENNVLIKEVMEGIKTR